MGAPRHKERVGFRPKPAHSECKITRLLVDQAFRRWCRDTGQEPVNHNFTQSKFGRSAQ